MFLIYIKLSIFTTLNNIPYFVFNLGCYNKHFETGIYTCIVCNQELFSSNTKYDSSCGWPAFNDVLDQGKVTLHKDLTIPGMINF